MSDSVPLSSVPDQPGSSEADSPLRGYSAIPAEILPDMEFVHLWPSSLRLDKHGRPYECVEITCPRCLRKLLLSRAEFTPPPCQPYALCHDCLKEGHRVQFKERWFGSGPVDLHLQR